MKFAALVTLSVLTFWGRAATAQDKFAIVHIDSGSLGKQISIQGFNSASCRAIIDNFVAGLRVDCPTCTIEASTCTGDLDSTFKLAWNHQKTIAPYLSVGNARILFLGRPRKDLNEHCAELSAAYARIGKSARCFD